MGEVSHSRLFISGTMLGDEEKFRKEFSPFGTIKDIQIIFNKETKEPKGICYIQFEKASQAAIAMEALNHKDILEATNGLIVKIAQDRAEPRITGNLNDEDRIMRIFIMVPSNEDQETVEKHFSQFAKVKQVVILKNNRRRNSSSFAFVRFYKASDTALALEQCDPKYKAIFGKLQDTTDRERDRDRDRSRGQNSRSSYGENNRRSRSPYDRRERGYDNENYSGSNNYYNDLYGYTGMNADNGNMFGFGKNNRETAELRVTTMVPVNPISINILFDIVPGLLNFSVISEVCYCITYESHQAARYARDKIRNLEYPPPHFMIIDIVGEDNMNPPQDAMTNFMTCMNFMMGMTNNPNAAFSAGLPQPLMTIDSFGGGTEYRDHNEINSSELKRLTKERLWVMGFPKIPSISSLISTFSKFGHLITIIPAKSRNYAYVHFGSIDSANEAMRVVDKTVIESMEMKVMIAEAPRNGNDEGRKRRRS